MGHYGATLFASALHRVAIINNIPIAARSWCHGSIEKRMRFLRDLGRDPKRTFAFDHVMTRIYAVMVIALVVSAACLAVSVGREGFSGKPTSVVAPSMTSVVGR